ncbi:MAG: hypothetical protein ABEH43_02245 [Flavobacteriales bacterium]
MANLSDLVKFALLDQDINLDEQKISSECKLFFEDWINKPHDRFIIQIENLTREDIESFEFPEKIRGCGIESFTKKQGSGDYRLEIQIPVEAKANTTNRSE